MVDSEEQVCTWSEGKTSTLPNWETVRVSKKSDDGGNSQRRGANERRGNSVCQRIGFFRDSKASRRYTGPFSHSENSAKITGKITIGPVVINHNSSETAER